MSKDTKFKKGNEVWVHDSHRCWRNFNGELGVIQDISWTSGEVSIYEVMVENGDVDYFVDHQLVKKLTF